MFGYNTICVAQNSEFKEIKKYDEPFELVVVIQLFSVAWRNNTVITKAHH